MGTKQDIYDRLKELIDDIGIGMLTTDRDGQLRSRPMGTMQFDLTGNLWFLTKVDSPKIDEIRDDEQVNVSYCDPKKNSYVSVSGRAKVYRDRTKVEELWTPIAKIWFDGPDDPTAAALCVTINDAEYWDSPSSRIGSLLGEVASAVTGGRVDVNKNEKIHVDR